MIAYQNSEEHWSCAYKDYLRPCQRMAHMIAAFNMVSLQLTGMLISVHCHFYVLQTL